MNQTDFTLVSYCVTRHLARSERAAMAKRCLAAVCFALRLLRPSLVVMGIDPTFPCAFWRAKGKRRCREGAPLMIHTTWWFKAIGVIERAVGSLAAGSCASLPPRLSSEEVEQLCTHSPADQSEICRRIAH